MFFIGIFGMENREKEIRDIHNLICKSCNSMTTYKLIKTYNVFHIFFIPVFKWGIKYYLISRCCRSIFEIPNELGSRFEGEEDVPVNSSDLAPVHIGDDSYCENSICPRCHRQIDEGFAYCPYCGEKLN